MKLLIQWAVTSSVLILIVLAVRFLFRNRLSARARYALWGVVLLRLLVPFQLELPAAASDALPVLASNAIPEIGQWEEPSIPVLPERSKPVAEFNLDIEATLEPGDILSYSDEAGCLRRDGETITWYRYILSPEQIVLALWLAGAGLVGAAVLLSNLRFGLGLRRRRKKLELADGLSVGAHIVRPNEPGRYTAGGQCPPLQTEISVYVAEGLPSPCLFGVLRPAVYLNPGAAEDETALRHVLAHELTHYAHFDHIWSALRCLALALHWYNPLVWLVVGLSKRDGELACDEGAVQRLGEGERIPYGRTLVDMVAARSLRPADLLSCSTAMTGGERSVKARVLALVKKPETVKTALFAVIAVVALSAVFVFAGREEPVRNLYGPYRYQVSHTQAVQFSPSPFSSQLYPAPITDPDLLEKALEILDSAADLLNTPEELGLDLSEAPFTSPRVTLLESPDDRTSGHTYLLYTVPAVNRDWCLLVTPAEMGAESYRVAGILDVSAPGGLELLARRQRSRAQEDIGHGSVDYNRYHARLTTARGIWLNMPMLHDGRVLTDPEQLEQVKELLQIDTVSLGTAALEGSRSVGPIPKWEEEWTHILSFSTVDPKPSWSGGPSYYYLKALDSGEYEVYTGDLRQDGHVLGCISAENWDRAEEILKSAPSVDDRQHGADPYQIFLNQITDTGAISYRTGTWANGGVISEANKLARAREYLTGCVPLDSGDPGPEIPELASNVVLFTVWAGDEQDRNGGYVLYWDFEKDGYTYILLPTDRASGRYTPIARTAEPINLPPELIELAEEQPETGG